jgi:hypothetical protein
VSSVALATRIARGDEDWDDGITFPMAPCEVSTLLFTDTMPFQALKRYAERFGTSLTFLDAYPLENDLEVLRAVFPGLIVHRHPHTAAKIRQAAVVAVSGQVGVDALVGDDRRYVTYPLEKHSRVLIFSGYKKDAEQLYWSVPQSLQTYGLLDGNDIISRTPVRAAGDFLGWVVYNRGVISRAVNLVDSTTLVVDCSSFRPYRSFNPSELSEYGLDQARAEEHRALLVQIIGRVLRGAPDKKVGIIPLNCPDEVLKSLHASDLFRTTCEQEPIFSKSNDIIQAIDQMDRWLAEDSENFPAPNPAVRCFRRRYQNVQANVEMEAIELAKAGANWSAIYRKLNLHRLSPEDRDRIKKACGFTT